MTFFVVNVVVVGVHFGFTHDEAVYLSQVNPSVPDVAWHAWRAWGTAILMAPVAGITSDVGWIRVWAAALTSTGLVLAFWPWLSHLRDSVAPLASFLFATTWFALYFGNSVQPNIYVALSAVGTVGLFVRLTSADPRGRRRASLFALGVVAFLLSLVRPSDGLLVITPLGLAALLAPSVRRPVVAVPLVTGWFFGWLPWLVESFVSFGGPVHRYRLSSAQDAVGGLHLNVHTASVYLRALDGPFYAGRQYGSPGPYSAPWLVITCLALALMEIGAYAHWRARRLASTALVISVAAALALFYVFLLGYSALRFLLPITALLGIVIAAGLVQLVRICPGKTAYAAAGMVGAALAANLGFQLASLHSHVQADRPTRDVFHSLGVAVRDLGVRRPCVVLGTVDPTPVAFAAHCEATAQTTDPRDLGAPLAQEALTQLAQAKTVVVTLAATEPDLTLPGWTEYFLAFEGKRVHMWVSP